MRELAVPLRENISRGPERVDIGGETFSTTTRRRMPFFVSGNQLYYWTRAWQSGEAQGLREIAAGESRIFRDGKSAAEWLLSDDEE
jgi:hypothetical protein